MKVTYKLLIITALCIPVQAFAIEKLSVSELLDRYAANQDKLKSFVAKAENVVTGLPQDGTAQQTRSKRNTEFRHEDSGSDLAVYYWWRDFNRGDDGIWVPKDRWHSYLWDGKRYYDHYRGPSLKPSKVTVISDEYYIKHAIAVLYNGAGPILGILFGDIDRFDSILRQSNSISVRSELERVGLVDCYVIDSKSEHGTYTVWLDPEHGYGIAKAVVHKGPEDFRLGRHRSSFTRRTSDAKSFFLENVRFENLQGVWVPMEADYRIVTKKRDVTYTYDTHYKITGIAIDPNHADLQSFVLDVENGTRVKITDEPGIKYTWQNGEIVADIDEDVTEAIGRSIDGALVECQVPPGPATAKKSEAAPNEPSATVDKQPERQADIAEAQRKVLSESNSFFVLPLVLIGLLIVGVIVWFVFRRFKA
jgi:hypothetical protein